MALAEKYYQRMAKLAKSVPLEWTSFGIFGVRYDLVMCPSKNENGSTNGIAAEWHRHQNYTIYLWEDIKEKIQRPLLSHEICEIWHYEKNRVEITDAHNATMPLEERFCREYLSADELSRYVEFKKSQGWPGTTGFELAV